MSSHESRRTSRSAFLKQAAGTTMVVAGAGVGAGAFAPQAAASSVTSGLFSLELDGVNVGRLAGADGGGLEYDVVLDPADPASGDNVQRKHIGGVKYEDFTIQVGSNMDKGMYEWVKDTFDKGYAPKSGALIKAEHLGGVNYNEKSRREFSQAFITEVTIPALDGASKDAAYINVKFSTPSVTDVAGSGAPVVKPRPRAWLQSNFRLIIKGVDTTQVASVDSFSWRIVSRPASSSARLIDPSPIGVSFPAVSLPSWQRWYDNFAVGGDATDERTGILELVGQDGAVLDVGLSNLGIYLLKPSAEKIKRFNVELYVEKLSLDVNS
jgi:hypothetical protein